MKKLLFLGLIFVNLNLAREQQNMQEMQKMQQVKQERQKELQQIQNMIADRQHRFRQHRFEQPSLSHTPRPAR